MFTENKGVTLIQVVHVQNGTLFIYMMGSKISSPSIVIDSVQGLLTYSPHSTYKVSVFVNCMSVMRTIECEPHLIRHSDHSLIH